MSIKQKAVLYTLAIVILSLILLGIISFLVTVIGSSVLATSISIVLWSYIVYRITFSYLNFLKEV